MVRKVAEGQLDHELLTSMDSLFSNFKLLIPQADRSPHLLSALRSQRELLSDTQLEEMAREEAKEEVAREAGNTTLLPKQTSAR